MVQQHKNFPLDEMVLDSLTMALSDNSFEREWFFDLQKRETVLLSDHLDEAEISPEFIEDNPDRFIPIESSSPHDQWTLMQEFILSLDDQSEDIRQNLLDAIQGRGAFRRFKNELADIGLLEKWEQFKERRSWKEALNWLVTHGVISENDIDAGMQIINERLAKREKHLEEIPKMITGAVVRCIDDHGFQDKLTVGQTYEVLDEQKQHLNIRIQHDQGKINWLPKSHFELAE